MRSGAVGKSSTLLGFGFLDDLDPSLDNDAVDPAILSVRRREISFVLVLPRRSRSSRTLKVLSRRSDPALEDERSRVCAGGIVE